MKKSLLVTLAAVALIGGGCSKPVAPTSTAVVPAGYQTYDAKYYRFSISHPADWTATASDGQSNIAAEFTSPLKNSADTFSENLNVIETGLTGKVTLEDFFERGRAQNQNAQDYKEISNTDTVLDGYPAKRLEFEFTYPLESGAATLNAHMIQYAALSNASAYTITCTLLKETAKEYVDTCDKMVASLKIHAEANK